MKQNDGVTKLRDLTWEEAARWVAADDRIIIGFGSIEQHGPAGVLGTDHFLAKFLARELAKETAVLLGPTIHVGMALHHELFPGTISIQSATYIGLVVDILQSLYRSGFRRIMIINGHGGNERPIGMAVETVQAQHPDLQVQCPLDRLFYEVGEPLDFGERLSHAGCGEMSLLWAMAPESRKPTDHITDEMVTHGAHGEGTKGASPETFKRMFPTGSKGDQRKADVEKGAKFAEQMIEGLVTAMENGWS